MIFYTIIDRYKGKIDFTRKEGKGVTFTFHYL
ncbi:HAMP domain-containing histidine kinase [Halalkalibacter wakoensis]|nr:HAMP domain-containing histidine kinase [Halalkalibacter wakoensis]